MPTLPTHAARGGREGLLACMHPREGVLARMHPHVGVQSPLPGLPFIWQPCYMLGLGSAHGPGDMRPTLAEVLRPVELLPWWSSNI
jgi:hypothetical protein